MASEPVPHASSELLHVQALAGYVVLNHQVETDRRMAGEVEEQGQEDRAFDVVTPHGTGLSTLATGIRIAQELPKRPRALALHDVFGGIVLDSVEEVLVADGPGGGIDLCGGLVDFGKKAPRLQIGDEWDRTLFETMGRFGVVDQPVQITILDLFSLAFAEL